MASPDYDNDLDNVRHALVSSWSSDDEDTDESDDEVSDDDENEEDEYISDNSEAELQTQYESYIEDEISDTKTAQEEMKQAKQEVTPILPNNEVFDMLYHDQEENKSKKIPNIFNTNIAVHAVESFDKHDQEEGQNLGCLENIDTKNLSILDLKRNEEHIVDNVIEAVKLENDEKTLDSVTLQVDTNEPSNEDFANKEQETLRDLAQFLEELRLNVVPVIVIEENELHEKTDDVKYDPTEHCRSIIDIIITDAVGLVEGFRAIQSDCINIETELTNVFLGNQSFTESDSSISIEQSDSQASDVPVSELSLKDASIQEKDSVEINNVKNVVDEDIESENDDLDVLSCVTRTKWYKEFIKQKRISTTRFVYLLNYFFVE